MRIEIFVLNYLLVKFMRSGDVLLNPSNIYNLIKKLELFYIEINKNITPIRLKNIKNKRIKLRPSSKWNIHK